MIADTGEIRAIRDEVARMSPQMARVTPMVQGLEVLFSGLRTVAGDFAPAGSLPRHAKPRCDRHGLRLVQGGRR
jgi:hypothetical protein